MTTETLQDEQAAKLLSQANLQRMRRQWDDAISSCMQVLYHYPDNWSAHALLGDIYSDQNRPDDAIQWYCMTLDIRPESTSVREKLSRLVNAKRHEIVQSIDPTRSYLATSQQMPTWRFPGGFEKLKSPKTQVKKVAGLLAVAAVLLVGVFMLMAGQNSKANGGQAPFTAGSLPTDTSVLLSPDGTAEKTGDQPQVSQSSTDPLPILPSAPSQATSVTAPIPIAVRDPADQAILTSIGSDPGLVGMGISVEDTQMNPATGSLTITYVSNGQPQPSAQARDMRDGLNIAKAALVRPQTSGVATFTLRCLCSTSNSAPVLTFVGNINPAAINSVSSNLATMTANQLSPYFQNTWWMSGQSPQ